MRTNQGSAPARPRRSTNSSSGRKVSSGRAVSMKDVARLASLDISTVSRALKGDSRRVAPATIERVQKLAQEIGYVPDAAASSLRGGKSRLLGVLIPRFSDVVIGQLVEAMETRMHAAGYVPLVIATEDDTELRNMAVRELMGRRVEGLILADALLGHEIPEELDMDEIPAVLAIRGAEGALSVHADDRLGGRLAAQHLIERGHDHVALLKGPSCARTARDRADGFLEEVHSAGVHVTSVAGRGFDLEAGYLAARELLSRGSEFSAVFCVNDYNAIGCARALTEGGLRVGRDVAIVGYNDIPLAAVLETPLTSVRTDISAMGASAVHTLLNRIAGESCASKVLEPRLVARASSML